MKPRRGEPRDPAPRGLGRLPGLLRWVGLPLLVFAAVWALFLHLQEQALQREREHTLGRFQQAAAERIARLREELDDTAEFHGLLRSHLVHADARDFEHNTRAFLAGHPYLSLVGYAPRLARGAAPAGRSSEERGIAPFAVGARYPLRLVAPADAVRVGFDLATPHNDSLAVLVHALSHAQNSSHPVATTLFHWPPGNAGSPHVAVLQSIGGSGGTPLLEGLPAGLITLWVDLGVLVRQALSPASEAAEMDFEIIDVTDTPRVLRPPPRVAAGTPAYVESVNFFDRRWLVLASPLENAYSAAPSAAVLSLGHAGLASAVLATLLVLLLQGRDASVRRTVRRQTRDLARSNRALAAGNTRLQQEITQRQQSERELAAVASLQQAILDNADYAIVFEDGAGQVRIFNPAAQRLLGLAPAAVLGALLPARIFPDHDIPAEQPPLAWLAGLDPAPGQPRELLLRRADEHCFHATLALSRVPGHGEAPAGVLAIIGDISERKEAEAHRHYLAHYDALTELPNRSLLRLRLAEALEGGAPLAVLFLDLDRFKTVNDSLGHQAGDELLQGVAQRIRACVGSEDTVARMGGDEFVVILGRIADVAQAQGVAREILGRLAPPFQVRGHTLSITPSIGIALHPEHGPDADTLLKHADLAMFAAKEGGRNAVRLFEPQLTRRSSERLRLERQLRQALESKAFELHYQPQLDCRSGAIVGVEALLRWKRGAGESSGPAQFIPVAEDSGLILPLGEWVLEVACAQAQAWRRTGLLDVPMAVNLSPRQFEQPDLLDSIRALLAETGLPHDRLELELTEGLVMRDPERTSTTLRAAKDMGLKISIDDFGTGYSSLAYLRRFPIDRLKIDRSFVCDIVSEPDDAAIARTIIAMAHELRLSTVAEGVEDEAQLTLLRQWGCEAWQGHLAARPMDAASFTALLQQRRQA